MNKTVGITLDKDTLQLLKNFGEQRGLGRSASVRLIVHEYFLNKEGCR